MTAQILKSQIKDEGEFRAALEKLRQAKADHIESGVTGLLPCDGFLDQFIVRTRTGPDTPDVFTIDYEIVNDDPPPPTAEELKAKALNDLRVQEQATIEAVLPQNKRRLFEMNAQRAQARLILAQSKGETELSAEDERIVGEFKAITDAIAEIQYAYAKREAEL